MSARTKGFASPLKERGPLDPPLAFPFGEGGPLAVDEVFQPNLNDFLAAINSRKASLFNSRRQRRQFTNAFSVQSPPLTYRAPSGTYRAPSGHIALPQAKYRVPSGTYHAPSGAYRNAVILLSLLFGAAKRNAVKSKKLIKE